MTWLRWLSVGSAGDPTMPSSWLGEEVVDRSGHDERLGPPTGFDARGSGAGFGTTTRPLRIASTRFLTRRDR